MKNIKKNTKRIPNSIIIIINCLCIEKQCITVYMNSLNILKNLNNPTKNNPILIQIWIILLLN